MTNQDLAIAALQCGQCLSLIYDKCVRLVEVHTVGLTTTGRPAMSAFQVAGGTNSTPIPDWRLFCFDECFDMQLAKTPSLAPRHGYRRGASQFSHIVAEV